MARACPICPKTGSRRVPASDVEIDSCPGCGGLWFDQGELELFPERPSARGVPPPRRPRPVALPQEPPDRPGERRLRHLSERSRGAAPAAGAGSRSCVTAACAVDVCPACEGIWLDPGELELLEGYVETPAPPAPAKGGGKWEVPEAAPAFDPYRAPGQQRATEAFARAAESIEQHPFGCGPLRDGAQCDERLRARRRPLLRRLPAPPVPSQGARSRRTLSVNAFDRVISFLTRRAGPAACSELGSRAMSARPAPHARHDLRPRRLLAPAPARTRSPSATPARSSRTSSTTPTR